MYKYTALSGRTRARTPHNPFAPPHFPSSHVFTGLSFQDQVSNCLRAVNSTYIATTVRNNLTSGGYSSKYKDTACVLITHFLHQQLAVWTVLAWTFMGL
jgi:hypothetical protein